MKLETYLANKVITQTAFAEKLGVSQVNMNRYVRGDRTPSVELMKAIHDATKGAVTFADWIGNKTTRPKPKKAPQPDMERAS